MGLLNFVVLYVVVLCVVSHVFFYYFKHPISIIEARLNNRNLCVYSIQFYSPTNYILQNDCCCIRQHTCFARCT